MVRCKIINAIFLKIIRIRAFTGLEDSKKDPIQPFLYRFQEIPMFKLIALSMHFSPYYQGPADPIVMEMIQNESNRRMPESTKVAEIAVTTEREQPSEEIRKAA